MNNHELYSGKSGSGKSEAVLTRFLQLAGLATAIVLLDPHGNLAKDLLLHLAGRHLLHRVIYDRLADTDLTPGYNFLTASNHPDSFQRYAQNEDCVRKFMALLIRRGGQKDAAGTPMIEKGILDACRLYIYQRTPIPLHWLAQLYTPGSGTFDYMVKNCTDADTKAQFEKLYYLNSQTRENQTGPADRRLRALLMSPSLAIRSSGATFDFDEALAKKSIIIIDGEGCNPDAASIMMSALSLKVIDSCKRLKHRVQLGMDEAINAGLVGLQESQALAEVRKWNLGITIIVQTLSFVEKIICDNVLQNTQFHRWFCQGSPEAAALAASDIAKRIVDPLRVHHTETRIRNADDGFELIENISHGHSENDEGETISRSSNKSHSVVRKTREVVEKVDRYMTLADQEILVQQKLMKMGPGWRWDAGNLEPHYEPMEQHLWHHLSGILGGPIPEQALAKLKEAKLQKAIAQVRMSPAYKVPSLIPPPSTPEPPPPPAARKSGMR